MDSARRRWLVGCLVLLAWSTALSGSVAAVDHPPWATETQATLERIVAGHNAAVDGATLGSEADPLRGQRVILTVSDVDGSTAQYSFETDERLHVVDFRAGSREDATVLMFTDRATVDRIADAPDRGAAFEAAVRAGEVRIEGVGLAGILWSLAGLVLWALQSPMQAVAVGAVAVIGLGGVLLVGAKVVGGGVAAGGASAAGATAAGTGTTTTTTGVGTTTVSASTGASATNAALGADIGGNTVTSTAAIDPVGVADETLSFFERLLFIVAIVKKLGARLRRRVEGVLAPLSRRLGLGRLSDAGAEQLADAGSEGLSEIDPAAFRSSASPTRRRVGPRRRRPRR